MIRISSKWKKFILTIISFFTIELFFALILVDLFNLDIQKISMTTSNLLSLVSSLALGVIYIFIYKKDVKKDFKDFKINFKEYFSIGFKYWLVGIVIMASSNIIIGILFPLANANNEDTVQSFIKNSPLISLFMTTITTPFIEEITFRKSFRNIINHEKIYILISGIVFGTIHVVFSLNSAYDLIYIIPYASLGIVLAMMYVKTKNIFTSIWMHALHNGIFTTISILIYLWGSK